MTEETKSAFEEWKKEAGWFVHEDQVLKFGREAFEAGQRSKQCEALEIAVEALEFCRRASTVYKCTCEPEVGWFCGACCIDRQVIEALAKIKKIGE